MRTIELAKVAAQAEALRLRRLAWRQAMRIVYFAVAGVFGVAVFVLLHVVGYHAMVPALSPLAASAILLGIDIVLAGIFAFLGSRNTPDSIEEEARFLRDRSIAELKSSLALTSMLRPASRILGTRRTAGMALGALATRLLARRS